MKVFLGSVLLVAYVLTSVYGQSAVGAAAAARGGSASASAYAWANDYKDKPQPPIKVPPPPNCICPAVVSPVCASDGKSFTNSCELACINKQRKQMGLSPLYIVNDGPCIKVKCTCPIVNSPACGVHKDGSKTTYFNYCFLTCASRQSVADKTGEIKLNNMGKCKDDDSCVCPLIKNPVCASNGETFGNPCRLACENKRLMKEHKPLLDILYYGECGDNQCENLCWTQGYQPICGSDGDTYDNVCYLTCTNLELLQQGEEPIDIVYFGPC